MVTELIVLRSNAGYYIGRLEDGFPFSRDSEYYNSRAEAEADLQHYKDLNNQVMEDAMW